MKLLAFIGLFCLYFVLFPLDAMAQKGKGNEAVIFFNSNDKWDKYKLNYVIIAPFIYKHYSGNDTISAPCFGHIYGDKLNDLKKAFTTKIEPGVIYPDSPGGTMIRIYFLYESKGFSISDSWICLVKGKDVFVSLLDDNDVLMHVKLNKEFAEIILEHFLQDIQK